MRRSIIAIIAIACLQLGYIVYTQYELSRDRLLAVAGSVTEPEKITPEIADLTTIDEPWLWEVFGELPKDGTPIDDVAELNVIANLRPQRAFVRNRRPAKRSVRVNEVKFDNTIITVARSEPYQFGVYSEASDAKVSDAVDTPAEPAAAEPKQKKNIFQKALPVVKKPYEWLKAIGSALK